MATPLRQIDSHQHVAWHGRDAAGLVDDMDRHGIEYAWLLTWLIGPREEQPEYHGVLNPARHTGDDTNPGVTLAEVLEARRAYPERFVLGYCPHPEWRRAPELLEAAHAMHGVRVCGEWKFRMLIDDPRCVEIFQRAGHLRMPVVLHLDVPYLASSPAGSRVYQPKWYGGTIDNLERVLQSCPGTTFVGHAPGFWREISGDAATQPTVYSDGPLVAGGRLAGLFERCPNLWADLSAGSGLRALRRDPAHARTFVTRFSERLLFGRDIYGQDLHHLLQTLDLSQEVVDRLYWQNAERLVGPPRATTHE